MPAKAENLALSDDLIDPNAASATELQSLLPGIGNVLASRIVAYREENGPFEQPSDLGKVPGIGDKLLSKLAPRISLMPDSGYSMRAESARPFGASPESSAFPMGMEPEHYSRASSSPGGSSYSEPKIEEPFLAEEEEFFRKPADEAMFLSEAPSETVSEDAPEDASDESLGYPAAPDFEQLFLRGRVRQDSAPPLSDMEADDTPISLRAPAASLKAPPTSLKAPPTVAPAVQEVEVEVADRIIPLHRPWRAWGIVAGIALISAAVGSIYGIRSQDGGPRAVLEQQVVRSLDGVADLKGSVKQLEEQSTSFASSINALDARLTDQERGHAKPIARRPAVEIRPTSPNKNSEVRTTVRQALRSLDPYLGQARAEQLPTDRGR